MLWSRHKMMIRLKQSRQEVSLLAGVMWPDGSKHCEKQAKSRKRHRSLPEGLCLKAEQMANGWKGKKKHKWPFSQLTPKCSEQIWLQDKHICVFLKLWVDASPQYFPFKICSSVPRWLSLAERKVEPLLTFTMEPQSLTDTTTSSSSSLSWKWYVDSTYVKLYNLCNYVSINDLW